MTYSRRDMGRLALGAWPAVMWTGRGDRSMARAAGQAPASRPNSRWGGVQVGVIAPYAFQGTATTIDEILGRTVELGLNAIELQAEPAEVWAGLPAPPAAGRAGRSGAAGARAGGPAAPPPAPRPLTPPEITAARARADEIRKWRIGLPATKYRDLRRKFDDAGVSIPVMKFNLSDSWSDEELDYAFSSAKLLGCRAITCEPPVGETKRLGLFADKHQLMLGFHGHADVTSVEAFGRPGSWEQAFFYSKFNGANIDIGHFTAGNNRSPIDFIRQYHTRITNLHLKDRKRDEGPNMPWGQGDTPIAEVLQLMKREKYEFMATIELEYTVEGSTPMAELKKCVQFCKDALA